MAPQSRLYSEIISSPSSFAIIYAPPDFLLDLLPSEAINIFFLFECMLLVDSSFSVPYILILEVVSILVVIGYIVWRLECLIFYLDNLNVYQFWTLFPLSLLLVLHPQVMIQFFCWNEYLVNICDIFLHLRRVLLWNPSWFHTFPRVFQNNTTCELCVVL